ncbi:MAG TPA: class I SAM-dependent methyltransferase [Chitinophagaceae bacterium]|nr:class I SAM-dependent methyltransferase [Chitinophagaceae bacterium]
MSNPVIYHPASWRDPSGFIFEKNGVLYRQVNKTYKDHLDHFIASGCYENLVKKNLLIPHELISENLTELNEWYATLKPEKIAFISYPYEWSFDMLKDAALLTLQLMKESIHYDMVLKDATPYNIQWHHNKLIFIDTLSFEKFKEKPWIAYRQFCECFLSPLLLMHYTRLPMHEMMLAYPDGIPLAVTKALLPKRSRFAMNIYLHIHLHEKFSVKKTGSSEKKIKFSKQKLLNLISSLEGLIRKLKLPAQKSTWSEYYDEASKRKNYLAEKMNIIKQWLQEMKEIKTAIDLGANIGEFSKLLSKKEIKTIATDFDPYCINELYLNIKEKKLTNIQPLIVDLSNPAPGTGMNNTERYSFISRGKADLVMALALIHHLAIGKNIPFDMIAEMFSKIGPLLIIEFVPKEDEKVQLMLQMREDIFTNYHETAFSEVFQKKFSIIKQAKIEESGRTLFLMKRIGE